MTRTRRSLGETFSLCQKAARGAGMPWGMADECGRAAQWLLQKRLPLFPLAELLEARPAVCAPNPDARPLRGMEGEKPMCPLSAGALLCDESHAWRRDGGCKLEKTARPILLAPFLATAAGGVQLEWDGARMFLAAGEVFTTGKPEALLAAAAGRVAIRVADEIDIPKESRAPDFPIPDDVFWGRMEKLAARTYVPSGSESRARGAGAGLTDND